MSKPPVRSSTHKRPPQVLTKVPRKGLLRVLNRHKIFLGSFVVKGPFKARPRRKDFQKDFHRQRIIQEFSIYTTDLIWIPLCIKNYHWVFRGFWGSFKVRKSFDGSLKTKYIIEVPETEGFCGSSREGSHSECPLEAKGLPVVLYSRKDVWLSSKDRKSFDGLLQPKGLYRYITFYSADKWDSEDPLYSEGLFMAAYRH